MFDEEHKCADPWAKQERLDKIKALEYEARRIENLRKSELKRIEQEKKREIERQRLFKL